MTDTPTPRDVFIGWHCTGVFGYRKPNCVEPCAWCRDEADKNVVSLTAAGYTVEQGWRDIASAPRDGERFWGKVGDDAIAMQWHPQFKTFVSSWRRMTMAPGYTFADTGLDYQDHSPNTHQPEAWRPLPAAPTAKADAP